MFYRIISTDKVIDQRKEERNEERKERKVTLTIGTKVLTLTRILQNNFDRQAIDQEWRKK